MLGDNYRALSEATDKLREVQGELLPKGQQLAIAEANYRRAKALKILELRQAGIAVTLIPDLCKGDENIANLKCARDCAEAEYKAVQSQINNLKLEMRILNDDITREWNSGGVN